MRAAGGRGVRAGACDFLCVWVWVCGWCWWGAWVCGCATASCTAAAQRLPCQPNQPNTLDDQCSKCSCPPSSIHSMTHALLPSQSNTLHTLLLLQLEAGGDDFTMKRRWDDDVVFKNQTRGEPKVGGGHAARAVRTAAWATRGSVWVGTGGEALGPESFPCLCACRLVAVVCTGRLASTQVWGLVPGTGVYALPAHAACLRPDWQSAAFWVPTRCCPALRAVLRRRRSASSTTRYAPTSTAASWSATSSSASRCSPSVGWCLPTSLLRLPLPSCRAGSAALCLADFRCQAATRT